MSRRLDHPQDRQGQRRLAGTGFARQPEPLARQQGKGDIVDRPDAAARVLEGDAQALDLQDRPGHCRIVMRFA
jgi:hypothetical protein